MRDVEVDNIKEINIDEFGNVEDDDSYEVQEPENPYEDDDGGWDPSIG
jgi:hypothetical protein